MCVNALKRSRELSGFARQRQTMPAIAQACLIVAKVPEATSSTFSQAKTTVAVFCIIVVAPL
eukprot:11930420-Alexandrium_andersonii.AAC.1